MNARRVGGEARATRSRIAATVLCAALCSVSATALFPLATASVAHAQEATAVAISTASRDGYARIIFQWPSPVRFRASVDGERVTIEFERPLRASLARLRDDLAELVRQARLSADGRTVTLVTAGPVALRSFTAGEGAIVDIIPTDPTLVARPAQAGGATTEQGEEGERPAPAPRPAATVTPAPKPRPQDQAVINDGPEPVADLPAVKVRTGVHTGYGRIVFDWPRSVEYRFSQDGTLLTVVFDAAARIDPSNVPRRLDAYVAEAHSGVEAGRTSVAFTIAEQARTRYFRVGNRVVLDIFEQLDDAARKAGALRAAEADNGGGEAVTEPVRNAVSSAEAADQGQKTPASPATDVEAESVEIVGRATLDGLAFDLTWRRPVAAAVFRRFGSVWLVFDRPGEMALDPVREALGDHIDAIEQWVAPDRTVLRVRPRGVLVPHARRAGEVWHVEMLKAPRLPDAAVEIALSDGAGKDEASAVVLRAGETGTVLRMKDPEAGDELVVVPVMSSSRGVMPPRRFVEFDLLETGQGVVVKAKADDLSVETGPTGVRISTAEGLNLSPKEVHARAAGRWDSIRADLYKDGFGGGDIGDPFRFAQFRRHENEITQSRQALQRQIAELPGDKRAPYRIDLARLLLANGLPAAAAGVLEATVAAEPRLAERGDLKMLSGAANFALGHLDEAESRFNDPRFDDELRALLWRGAVAAARGQWERADRLFERGGLTPAHYPPYLRNRIDLLSIRAGLERENRARVGDVFANIDRDALSERDRAQLRYLEGLRDKLAGDLDKAVEVWDRLAKTADHRNKVDALLSAVEARYKAGMISPAEAAAQLEDLRYEWRGGELELRMLTLLGEAHLEAKQYDKALGAWKLAVSYFPQDPRAQRLAERMSDVFAGLFIGGEAEKLEPLKALALFYNYRELTPVGDRGDEMIRIMADKLAAVELLDEAAELLQHQISFRLTGLERTRVGTRLAVIHLLNNDPRAALRTLRDTLIRNMPALLRRQRRHIEARSLAALDEYPGAFAVLSGDDSVEARMLRADFYWKQKEWEKAAESYAALLDETVEGDQPLDQAQKHYVLRQAVALVLANDTAGVERVREAYGSRMAETDLASEFLFVTDPISSGRLEDFAAAVEQVSAYESFLDAYRERVYKDRLSAIN